MSIPTIIQIKHKLSETNAIIQNIMYNIAFCMSLPSIQRFLHTIKCHSNGSLTNLKRTNKLTCKLRRYTEYEKKVLKLLWEIADLAWKSRMFWVLFFVMFQQKNAKIPNELNTGISVFVILAIWHFYEGFDRFKNSLAVLRNDFFEI